MNPHTKSLLTTSALYFACSVAVIAAEVPGEAMSPQQQTSSGEARNAAETVQEATQVVQKLRSEAGTKDLLQQAKAVFIVPDYARAALGVGGAGGQGVLVANNDGSWSSPAFYNIGAINVGLQAGAEAGSIAFLIMSDDAMQNFEEENNFSLNADAGLTIADYSKRGQATLGKGADVVVWSDTKGLFGDLAISVADVMWDDEANRAFYQKQVSAREIIAGNLKAPADDNALKSEFSALEQGEATHSDAPASTGNSAPATSDSTQDKY